MDHSISLRPVSTLPGFQSAPENGTTCDDHPDRPAVKRVQGETDSMGCEYLHFCQECFDRYKAGKEAAGGGSFEGACSCGKQNVPLFPVRYWDEGSYGPVYYKCADCRSSIRAAEAEEFADSTSDPDVDFGNDEREEDLDDFDDPNWSPTVNQK